MHALNLYFAAVFNSCAHSAGNFNQFEFKWMRGRDADRAGMALVLAALAADGTTTIGNVQQIDRGYQQIDKKLRKLGAKIDRIE